VLAQEGEGGSRIGIEGRDGFGELQLIAAIGARLVIPVGSRDRQLLTIVTRHGNDWLEETDGYCVFVPLIGAEGFAG